MQTLLASILTWLSLNFGLPAGPPPHVEFVPAHEMQALRQRLAEQASGQYAARADLTPKVQAFYDRRTGVIYLPEGWEGRTPAEESMLVHEAVHHLQAQARIPYACPEEREKLAYQAQKKWLEKSGLDLESEFQIDAMTLLVRTNCMR